MPPPRLHSSVGPRPSPAPRRCARDSRFAFGTWKIEVLAGYTSALFLLGVAAAMAFAAVERICAPQIIHFPEAIADRAYALAVNAACPFLVCRAHAHREQRSDHCRKSATPYHYDLYL